MEKKLTKNSAQQKPSFLKKNWHILAIVALFLFGMSQCTRSCSRAQDIKTKDAQLVECSNIISMLEQRIDTLNNNVNYYTALFESEKNHNSNFASIATGNQAELYGKINGLEKQNAELEKKAKSLAKENSMLRDSIAALVK